MALHITTHGDIDQILVSALSRDFVRKIYRHCWGKNNTPYFAGNCFRGVLYFDERLAAKYAEDLGLSWDGWLALPKFHQRTGACFEHGLSMTVDAGEGGIELAVGGLPVVEQRPRLAELLEGIGPGEVLCLLGSVDKGEMTFSLPDFDGPFDPGDLSVSVERFSDLYSEEVVITGLSYAGRALSMEIGQSRGKSMIDPLLIDADGKLLDMYDFS